MNVFYPDGESMPGTLPLIRYSPHAANSVSNAWAWLWAFAGNNASRLGSYCGETLGGICAQWEFLCEVCGETCNTPKQVFGDKFYSRKSRRTKRDRVTRNGADSRFSVYVKSKCLHNPVGTYL